MIVLTFFKGSVNAESFVLHYNKPLSTETARFVNATDNINAAKMHVSDIDIELTMKETEVKFHNKTFSAIEFTATPSDSILNQLEEFNTGYLTLNGSRINEELEIHVKAGG